MISMRILLQIPCSLAHNIAIPHECKLVFLYLIASLQPDAMSLCNEWFLDVLIRLS